jgi:hypothetical protein
MEEMQFPAARVERVIGYADRIPLSPDKPLDPANRRISILVLKETDTPKKPEVAGGRGTTVTAHVAIQ